MAPHLSRLRAYRKSAGLSQRELALLLGLRSQSVISRYELQNKCPSFETLIGCEWLFKVSARDLFPGLAVQMQNRVAGRTKRLMAAKPQAFSLCARNFVRGLLGDRDHTPS